MPTVKISELPEIVHLSTNTGATLIVGVDLETGTTGKMNVATLGEGLYAYQPLKVGQNQVLFSNTIGQFSGNSATYLQINNQNFNANGSADYVASASDSDNTNKYIDMGINGFDFSDPDYSSMDPYDGYVYVRGPTDISESGNLVIGTASSFANIVYIVGGTVTDNIVARMTKTDLQLSAGYNIKFGDGSIQSVAASPVNYSQAAFALANDSSVLAQASFNVANTASANTFITQGVDVSQNARITIIEGTDVSQNARMTIIEGTDVSQNARMTIIEGTDSTQNTWILATDLKMQSAFSTANNAYNKANNALANTTGTFAGDLTITGNVLTQGTISLNNSTFATNTAFVKITASDDFATVPPSNTNYMLHITGKANSVTRVVLDSFGVGANGYPLLSGRHGRGSAALPTATGNNDVLLRFAGNGYTGTQFPSSSPSKIDMVAAEDFSDTNRGTRIEFWNTPNGSNTIQRIASFNADAVEFTGVVKPEKGFIYSPIEYPGAQTAITIDFANNSLLRCNTSAGVVVSFTNYIPGKVVELWITNTAGTGQTFTHGCSAINSTVNSTTYSIPATSSILARYYSFDGALANTYVSIVKS